MLGTTSKDISNPSFEPTPSTPKGEEDYTFSTPRSELNNPMADPSILLDSASKEEAPAEPSKKQSMSTTSSRLKRADPKDLPSYPSKGYQNLEASAGKAALLAHSQSKSPELWKPDPLPAAGAAASLANTVKSPEPWNPGPLPAAAAAALLAGDSTKSPEVWKPTATSKSASKAAIHVKDKKSVDSTYRSPTSSSSNALAAAGLANQGSTKAPKTTKPASSTPAYDINRINTLASQNAQNRLSTADPAPSQAKVDKNMSDILRAATISMSKSPTKSAQPTQSQFRSTNMPPGSYYSHIPTTAPTVAAESSNSKLHRKSSVAAASTAAASELSTSSTVYERQTKYYPHLEEAARKAASERLARLQAEHEKARMASGLPANWHTQGARSAVEASNKTSSSPTTARRQPDAEDYARSMKIKAETAKLTKQMDSVDKDRQARDYLALLSVAEKNVKSRMQDLETKVAADQGRVPKHLQEEWDAKAKLLSEEQERKRNAEVESKKGKINMGGGLWYDQEDLERIAKGNVQPILDEINDKAEKERARLEVIRIEREEKERERKLQAEREAETKAEVKKAKALEKSAAKSRREAEKAEEKQRKAELKESQRQEKERQKAEKQAAKAAAAGAAAGAVTTDGERADEEAVQDDDEEDMEELEPRPMSAAGNDRVAQEHQLREDQKREKGWFGSIQRRLSRKDRNQKQGNEDSEGLKRKISEPIPFVGQQDGDFYGHGDDEVSSLSSPERSSLRDVALAGTASPDSDSDEDEGIMKRRARYIPSDSSSTDSDDLYTTQRYVPTSGGLTSATYNPTEEMPAFVPDADSDDEETKRESQTAPTVDPVADQESESPAEVKKHHTFGDLLKKPFEGFTKGDIKKEEVKEKEVQKEQDETVQTAVEQNEERPTTVPVTIDSKDPQEDDDEFEEAHDKFDESGKGVASNAGEGVRIMDPGKEGEKRASKFSEDL